MIEKEGSLKFVGEKKGLIRVNLEPVVDNSAFLGQRDLSY